MIPLEALRAVRVVVSHCYPDGSCPDGLSASMIIKDVLPNASYRFVSHNTREYNELAVESGMLFVDITPPESRVAEFRDAGAIVLDHHKDKEQLVSSFGDRGVFAHEERDPGVSGALLAFEHVWLLLSFFSNATEDGAWIRNFAEVAGIRDTWQTTNPRWAEACEQAATLIFFPIDDWLDNRFYGVGGDGEWRDRLSRRVVELGCHFVAKFERETTALIESAYSFVTGAGTRVTVLPSIRISDAAERIFTAGFGARPHVEDGADVVVGFAFHVEDGKPHMRLSFRSRRGSGIDVSAFARLFPGGGGHTHAAGASVVLGDPGHDRSPYVMIENLMNVLSQAQHAGFIV